VGSLNNLEKGFITKRMVLEINCVRQYIEILKFNGNMYDLYISFFVNILINDGYFNIKKKAIKTTNTKALCKIHLTNILLCADKVN